MSYPIHYQRNSHTDETCKNCKHYYANARRCDLHKISPHAQATCGDNTLTTFKKSDEYKLMLAAEKAAAKVEYIEPEKRDGKQSLAALIEVRDWLGEKHASAIEEESPEKNIVYGYEVESLAVIEMIEAHANECSYLEGWQDYLKALKSLEPVKMLIARGMIRPVERESLDITIRARLHIDPEQSAAVLSALGSLEVKTEQMEVEIKTSFDQMELFGMAA